MARMTRSLAAGCVALALAGAPVAPARAQADPGVSSHPMIGEAAPSFDLKTVAGGTLSLADLRGRLLVLHFGTSW